jgi:uncharacterized protein (DUF433 family)
MDMISVDRSRVIEDGIRAILSLRETVVLAKISEAKIRKDIEKGFLSPLRGSESRHCFRWPDVFFLGAVYRSEFLTGGARQKVLRKLVETLLTPAYSHEYNLSLCDQLLQRRVWQKPSDLITGCNKMMIDAALFIDFDRVRDELTPRVDLYATGLSRIEEKEGTLGGEAVFKNTRLSVRHVGKMSADGEPAESILSDYPYLREDDIQFARLYHEAHPTVGRPRGGAETFDVANNP